MNHVNGPTCTIAELIPVCQELWEPNPNRLIAMIGILKNLIRVGGVPSLARSKGVTSYLSCSEVRELLILMELRYAGFTPSNAIELYEAERAKIETLDSADTVTITTGRTTLSIDTRAIRLVAMRHIPHMFTGRREKAA